MMHYHGTPITPRRTLLDLGGKNFCVSFSDPRDVEVCHRIGQSVMLDNGAFSAWTQGKTVDWGEWAEWARPWLDYPTTWAVLPDVIDGDEDANDTLLDECDWKYDIGGVPVWHMHESFERLQRLVTTYGQVCFGSSGAYAVIGVDAWWRRCTEAFDMLAAPSGRVPWVHMLRGMALSGEEFPFASVDSTDVARNHKRNGSNARAMADRWDAMQCPGRWVTHRQERMEIA